jgi:hypothetical protein
VDLHRKNRRCVQRRAEEQCSLRAKEGSIPADWKDEPEGPWHVVYLGDDSDETE